MILIFGWTVPLSRIFVNVNSTAERLKAEIKSQITTLKPNWRAEMMFQ